MHSQRLDDLFYRYCEKSLTGAEYDELMRLFLMEEYRQQLNALIDQLIRDDHSKHHLSQEIADDILTSIFTATAAKNASNINTPSETDKEPEVAVRSLWFPKLVAASAALMLFYGGYRWMNVKEPIPAPTAVLQSVYGKDVAAGSNKASLTLANGQTLDLSTITSKNLESQPGTTINRSIGEVSYLHSRNTDGIGYNILKTPLGGQYKVILPDGSRAWLNAGSSLKYPTAFTGSERNVEMTGEVYFEIEHNEKMPFHVRVLDKHVDQKDTEITVLGTHFNICSYDDEPTIQATLLEGSVKVKKGQTAKVLAPGQQAMVRAYIDEGDIALKTVDAESVVAWKEGRFEFNGNIREIMRQISRWYDIDVHYEGDVERKSFAGTISRKNNVSEVLKMLELTGGIQFRIDDRKITVKNTDEIDNQP